MILFSITFLVTLQSSSNDLLDTDDLEYANESSNYDYDMGIDYFSPLSSHFDSPTVSNRKLTDDMIRSISIVILQRHNHIRQQYNLPILRLSKKLNSLCESYAKKHGSGDIGMVLDYLPEYGINAHYGSRYASNPNYVMELWINESSYYNPKHSDEDNMTKMPHLSQILWKSTAAIGVSIRAINYLSSETFVLLILYDPPSKSANDFKQNIPTLNADTNSGLICYQPPFLILLNFYLLRKFQKFTNI